MKEFSSYYNVKANEIPADTYINIGYFEPVKICKSSVKQKSTTAEKILSKNTKKPIAGLCHE